MDGTNLDILMENLTLSSEPPGNVRGPTQAANQGGGGGLPTPTMDQMMQAWAQQMAQNSPAEFFRLMRLAGQPSGAGQKERARQEELDRRRENGARMRCGKKGHFVRECDKLRARPAMRSNKAATSSQKKADKEDVQDETELDSGKE